MPSKLFPSTNKILERTQLITADGVVYELHMPPTRNVISEDGLGMPPIDYVSQRGAYQHGETVRDFFLKPRAFQVVIRNNYCDRTAYWAGRKELLDVLRPNRGGNPGLLTFRRILPGLGTRDITCVGSAGPAYAARRANEWDEFSFTENLKFTAYNPIWYNPAGHTSVFTPTIQPTFPMSFPVTFYEFGTSATITNNGDWLEYPVIRIDGPMTDFLIHNNTTGESIGLGYTLPGGQWVTINLAYGLKTVMLQDVTSIIGTILPNSDLAQFHLEPGPNSISMWGDSASGASRVTISYVDRYLGI